MNYSISTPLPALLREPVATPKVRKHSRFETCKRHAGLLSLPRRRRAEFFVEGGPAGQSGCEDGICRLWPGTDLFEPSVCTSEFELDWTEPR